MTTKAKDETVEVTDAKQAPINKKRKRGISNDTKATSKLKFDERRDANPANGLFTGQLLSCKVDWATIKEDNKNLQSFAGCAIPILHFEFGSLDKDDVKRKYVSLRLFPVESNALTIVGGTQEWKVNSVLNWMKHIMDVYVLQGKEMTEEQEDMLCLPYDDSDDDSNYVPVEAETVIDGWRTLFENFAKMINNDGKPYFKQANGVPIPVWMKLLRFTKNKGTWYSVISGSGTGDLGFSSFVGEGAIERYNDKTPPMLKIDFSKESITYKETQKPQKTTPTIGGVAGMGGTFVNDQNLNFGQTAHIDNPFGEVAQDLPF